MDEEITAAAISKDFHRFVFIPSKKFMKAIVPRLKRGKPMYPIRGISKILPLSKKGTE